MLLWCTLFMYSTTSNIFMLRILVSGKKIVHIVWYYFVGFMVFNATFNNISAILWLSVLLVEETGVPRENPTTI